MFWIMTFTVSVLMVSISGCSIEASVWDLDQPQFISAEVRRDKDFQNTEMVVSGQYQVQGQIAETAEKRISGNYVVEGVIAYE